jgi:outer membrane biosynthesis protein TonB
MNRGLTISCIGHACALGWGLLVISAQPMDAPPMESMPVQFISTSDFTQLTQGVKNAPQLKIPDQKPLADKVDAAKSVDQLAPKVADKPAITTDTSKPKSDTKPDLKPDPKQADKPDPKPDAKQADKPDKPKTPEYKPDQIADLLKKDQAKNPPKPDDSSTPQKPAQNTPKFDANQVAELLDKRDPQRQVAAAQTINDTANLGAANGAPAALLSQNEIDALRARISSCWSPPPGVEASTKAYVVLRVLFRQDGSLGQDPILVEATASELGPALAESAKRALLRCQPFTMLKPEHYDQWKDMELKFDPHELLGG